MQYFYAPQAEPSDIIILDAEESRHCLRVLRLRTGDRVEVVDGNGNLYHAEIISDKGRQCELRIVECRKHFHQRDFKISIGMALPKNRERFEWFLEKATELGIDEVFPLLTERSERSKLNAERLQKILISAMKQSGKAYLPVLHEPQKFQDMLLTGAGNSLQKFIAVCEENLPHLKDVAERKKDALVLIGPEGDFTEDELKRARANGFQAISLGKSRLRVETAGIASCHILNLLND